MDGMLRKKEMFSIEGAFESYKTPVQRPCKTLLTGMMDRYIRRERSLSPRRDDRSGRMGPPVLHERVYPRHPFPPQDDVILVSD
jgi:hypothetical protein